MTMGEALLAVFTGLVTLVGGILVFRNGSGSRIDAKQRGELDRLYGRLDAVEKRLGEVERSHADTSGRLVGLHRLFAAVFNRARSVVAELGGPDFDLTDDEYDELERTQPVGYVYPRLQEPSERTSP